MRARASKLSDPTRLPLVLLTLFFLGQCFVSTHPFLQHLNRAVGFFVVLVMTGFWRRRLVGLGTEVKLFAAFIIWAACTGAVVAADYGWFSAYVRLLVQIWFLVFAVSIMCQVRKSAGTVWMLMVLSAFVLLTDALVTGKLFVGLDPTTQEQLGGLAKNSNGFGLMMLVAVMAIVFAAGRQTSVMRQVATLSVVAPFVVAIISTASRKSFLGLYAFFLAWGWFCGRRQVLRIPGRTLLVAAAVVVALTYLGSYVGQRTFLGERLRRATKTEKLSQSRADHYARGLEVFLQNPVAGVGLGNYLRVSGQGEYAHSDYIEVLATTGAGGFILYALVYVALWRRLSRISRFGVDARARSEADFCKAVVVVLLLLGLGVPNFLEVGSWTVLAGIIGFASAHDPGTKRGLGREASGDLRHYGGSSARPGSGQARGRSPSSRTQEMAPREATATVDTTQDPWGHEAEPKSDRRRGSDLR